MEILKYKVMRYVLLFWKLIYRRCLSIGMQRKVVTKLFCPKYGWSGILLKFIYWINNIFDK